MNELPRRYFASRGYAHLLIDFRGLGGSSGRAWDTMNPAEGRDGAQAVEWASELAQGGFRAEKMEIRNRTLAISPRSRDSAFPKKVKSAHDSKLDTTRPANARRQREKPPMIREVILLTCALCLSSGLARAQGAPTTCPTNYTCSYQSSSTHALLGNSQDGQPESRVGFLTFDTAGNWSGVLSGNLNGTVVANTAVSGTCVSGSDTTLGTLNFKVGLGGKPASLAFVTAPSGVHTDLIIAGSMLASDTRVQVAVCHGN